MNGSFAKKILASFALLLVLSGVAFSSMGAIGSAFSPNVAHAEDFGPQPQPQSQSQDTNGNGSYVPFVTQDAENENAAYQNNAAVAGDIACGFTDVLCGLVKFVGFIFIYVSNLVATVTGLLADFSLWYSIQSSSYGLVNTFLETGWKTVLGFTNLIFIFTLFVVAFSLIFGTDIMKIEPKRAFGYVVLMALLVNFSFLITRSVVEVGNVTATFLYTKISTSSTDVTPDTDGSTIETIGDALGNPSDFLKNGEFTGIKSVSLGILSKINPQELITDSATAVDTSSLSFYISYLFLSVAVAAFNMILIYIFVSIAFLFMGRFVGIALCIVMAPIAFASVAIPALKEKSYIGFDDWLKQVVGLTVVAPIYVLFLYLTILFLNANLFGKQTGMLLITVTVMIKLMLVALVLLRGKALAVSISGHVGDMIGKVAGGAATLALGAATGGTAMLARQTIGRAGAAVAANVSLQRIASAGPSEKIQAVQNRLASGIRNFGVGKYRLGRTQLGRSAAGAVQNSGLANIGASTAGGLQRFGKNLYTVNPLDRAIGGMSARKAAGMLAGYGGAGLIRDKDGNIIGLDKDNKLNNMLARDYVADMQKKQARDRAINIAAIANAKKTLTNVNANAMTAGLNSAGGGQTAGPSTGGSSGPITVSGPNTGVIPNVMGSTGAKGPVPGSRLPNNFNGFKLADQKSSEKVEPETPVVAAEKDGVAARAEYDRTKQIETAQMASGVVPELHVENLSVNNLNMNGGNLPARPGSMGKGDAIASASPVARATNLLSGIQMNTKPVGALSYKPDEFAGNERQKAPSIEEQKKKQQEVQDKFEKNRQETSQWLQNQENANQLSKFKEEWQKKDTGSSFDQSKRDAVNNVVESIKKSDPEFQPILDQWLKTGDDPTNSMANALETYGKRKHPDLFKNW